MFWSVDEIENSIVTIVGDDGSKAVLLQTDYAVRFKVRDVLRFADPCTLCVDDAETQKRLEDAKRRLNSLFSH